MSGYDIIRRRLANVKSLSEQLRESTSSSNLNINIVKQLLYSAKNIYDQNLFDKQNQSYQSKKDLKSEKSNSNIPINKSYRSLFPETEHLQNEPIQNSIHNEQLITIRQQNAKLQQKIMIMKADMARLEQEKLKLEDRHKKQIIPFFQINQSLDAFICRLNIGVENYQKMDYALYEINLKMDRLSFFRKQKSSLQEFDLTSIKEVHYGQGNVIVYRFLEIPDSKQQQHLTSIFIKFESPQQKHKWDLGIFSNFQIVGSLNKPNLFEHYYKNIKEQEQKQKQIKLINSVKQKQEINEKDLLKLLLKKREEYLEVKNLISENLQKKIKNSRYKASQSKKDQLDREMLNTSYKNDKDEYINQSNTKLPNNQVLSNQIVKEEISNAQKKQRQQIQQAEIKSQHSRRMSLNARISLQNGYSLTKYSKDGFKPHDKRVFLSLDGKKLCWSEKDNPTEYKSIPIETILKIDYGVLGDGIIKHIKNPDPQFCTVIEYITKDSKKKTIQLGSQSRKTIKTLSQELNIFLKSVKSQGQY